MKRAITVLFSFRANCNGHDMIYRAVQAADGGYRMEKRGFHAKQFRTIMWCGHIGGLVSHYKAVKTYYGKR